MTKIFGNRTFCKVCDILPITENGKIKRYSPQKRYDNVKNRKIHNDGRGYFCKFSIPTGYNGAQGVYIISVNGSPKYAGESEDLRDRFNANYGNISPRNCYTGGRITNCRINKYILNESENNYKIELFFSETRTLDAAGRKEIERSLIDELDLKRNGWNKR
jgi:hypothetical protein